MKVNKQPFLKIKPLLEENKRSKANYYEEKILVFKEVSRTHTQMPNHFFRRNPTISLVAFDLHYNYNICAFA